MRRGKSPKEENVGKRGGNCRCGISYLTHPRCISCGVLAHSDLQFCRLPNSEVIVGYIPTGNRCYNCKKEAKDFKERNPRAKRRAEITRAASKRYRLKNLDRIREQERRLSRENSKKIWLATKMKLKSDPAALAKRRQQHRDWVKKQGPDYYKRQHEKRKAYKQQWREEQCEKNTLQPQPETSQTL